MDIFDYGEYIEANREDAQDADRHYDPDGITTPTPAPIPNEPEEDY